jgi:hypothetical protein
VVRAGAGSVKVMGGYRYAVEGTLMTEALGHDDAARALLTELGGRA